jgi:hypothetical protein
MASEVRLAVGILVLSAVLSAPAAASVTVTFRTPSGNIGCVYSSGVGPGAPSLRCDIRSGLRPRPARPRNCDLDWGDSYVLNPTGRAVVLCHGDTTLDPRARVLRYGSRWQRGAFTCRSKRTGLRCRASSGHGFFLSKQHSYRF